MNTSRLPPVLGSDMALFLDFDGTLVHFAERPDDIVVPSFLPGILGNLSKCLDGALALVSGRSVKNIDRHLGGADLAMAGEHGGQWRLAGGVVESRKAAEFGDALSRTQARLGGCMEIVIEPKSAGFAVHYRLAPHASTDVGNWMKDMIKGRDDLELVNGKFVCELRSAGVSKAVAIREFMQVAPFVRRQPVFVGDDVTDEDGFAAVNALGGLSIKVGEGKTVAKSGLSGVDDVLAWLQEGMSRMSLPNGDNGIRRK